MTFAKLLHPSLLFESGFVSMNPISGTFKYPRSHVKEAIVNISSASAHFSSPGDIVYAMSKAAVESLTINMAEAIAPRGLRVNTVVPGFTDNGHIGFQIPEVREYMSSFAVLGDVSDASVVARAVSFLLSDDASRTTGSILDVSGGSLLGARGKAAGSVREMLLDPHSSQPDPPGTNRVVDEVRIEPSSPPATSAG